MDSRAMRRVFFAHFWTGLRVVWPILSALLVVMVALGVVVGVIEDWPLRDSLYFTFVSGLTIGYGDLVPKSLLARALAIGIGVTGVLLTGLITAVGVQALLEAMRRHREP
jgi:Ion channel